MELIAATILSATCAFSLVVLCLYKEAKRLELSASKPTAVLCCTGGSSKYEISHRSPPTQSPEVDFSFVIPCYNESTRINKTLFSLKNFLEERRTVRYEILVVDDGSTDRTVDVVQDFVKHSGMANCFRVLRLEQNSGKGAAVTEGLLRAKGKVCLFMDADDATEISELRSLHEKLVALQNRGEEVDGIVVGSRAYLQERTTAERSLYRNILMHGFHFLVWIVTFTDIQDTQCGFKLFTHTAVHRIFPHVKTKRWCFDVEVLLLAKKQNIAVQEVPVKWTEVEGSKLKMYHIVHMAWELGLIFFGYTFLPSWKIWRPLKTD